MFIILIRQLLSYRKAQQLLQVFIILFSLTSFPDCWAEPSVNELDISGHIALDIRGFVEEGSLPGQLNESVYPSIEFKPELDYEWNSGDDRLKFTPYLRFDAFDDNRRLFDIREAFWQHQFESADLRIGFSQVFWGVAESRHLVNIINQVDTIEDIDEEDRLGQPMINLDWFSSRWGTFEFFLLPGFRERRFADRRGRLRLAEIPIDQEKADYESSLGKAHVDTAFRWSHIIGEWNIGISYFYGTGREARFKAQFNHLGPPEKLLPHYDIIHQTGIDLQWTHENWLWKLEAITRSGNDKIFQALVGGFEYSFYGIMGTAIDLSVLGEYLWDNRSHDAPLTPFDNDVYTGLRMAFNDEQNSELLLGTIVDVNNQATIFTLEASRRISDSWKISIDSRAFFNISEENRALKGIRDDSFINFQLSFHF